MKLFVPILCVSLALPITAQASEANSFRYDGHNYIYRIKDRGLDQVIRGKRDDGTKFRYVVRNGTVRGNVDGDKVWFKLSDVETTVSR